MYFPMLRGKQHELFALHELSSVIVKSNKVTPIIEPDNLNATTSKVLPLLNDAGMPIVLVVNPQFSKLKGTQPDAFKALVDSLGTKSLVTIGYFITDSTSFQDIQSVMNIYSNHSFAFIHTTNSAIKDQLLKLPDRDTYHIFMDGRVSSSYQSAFINKNRVLIRDSFNAKNRNVDYPSDEYFSDLFFTYRKDFFGFGDFQIIGSRKDGGGPAYAVAIHFTYLKEPGGHDLWVKHFISDDTQTTANVQGKYFQALRKLINFLNSYSNTPETLGATDFRNNQKSEVFPGLGMVKRWSIKHHIEIITQLI